MAEHKEQGTVVMQRSTAEQAQQAVSASAVLVLIHPAGNDLGRRTPLEADELWVGRLPDMDIAIDTESVSRRHARVLRLADGWYVEDMGSTNGSFVNDVRLEQPRRLTDGDQLRFGDAVLKFLSGENLEAAYHEEIYRLSTVDALTGVYNKRFFVDHLDREIARAERHGQALSVVLFDLDHFKKVNDTYGHLGGDEVLREICRRMRPRVRKDDLMARYGGEEFAIILPQTSHAGAVLFADALRLIVARESFTHDGAAIAVTISVGVACHEPPGQVTPVELIRRADENLYAAKRSGRNRVVG